MILGIVTIHTKPEKTLVSKLYCSLEINGDYLQKNNFPNLQTNIKQDKAMIGSPEKSMTKQKLDEQLFNAIFYFFIQHDIIKKSHSLEDIHV